MVSKRVRARISGSTQGWRITAGTFGRDTWLVVSISSDRPVASQIVPPTVPFSRARNPFDLPVGRAFVVTAHIPAFGLARSLWLTPGLDEAEVAVEAFDNRSAALVRALELSERGAQLHRLPDVRRLQGISFKRARRWFGVEPPLARSIARLYAAAAHLTFPREPAESPWLTIVVPIYNARTSDLDEALDGFKRQHAGTIEVILSDDGSTKRETRDWLDANADHLSWVRVLRAKANGGIGVATRTALAEARGQWIAFHDHDDTLAPGALATVRTAIERHPEAKLLYTDEMVVDAAMRPTDLMAKPAFDPVMLTGMNYMNHLTLVRQDHFQAIGGMRLGFDGSQDYDLVLRASTGLRDHEVLHVPYPAYRWRQTGGTYSQRFIKAATERARRAITEHMETRLAKTAWRLASVEPALTPTLHRPILEPAPGHDWPEVTVIVPSRNSYPLIRAVIRDVLDRTEYPHLRLHVVDNGSTDRDVLDLYDHISGHDSRFTVDVVHEPFNFSRSINRGLRLFRSGHVLLLNNDVTVEHADWLREMVSCLALGTVDNPVGIVGAKLLYPDGTLQHAGVTVGVAGLAVHRNARSPAHTPGSMARLHVRSSLACVTGAVMLLSRETIDRLGYWDEEHFAVAYNDVDYCLRAWKVGIRTVWTPFATLVHHESLSRGGDASGERARRFKREKADLHRIHGTEAFVDPADDALSRHLSGSRSLLRPSSIFGQFSARTWFNI